MSITKLKESIAALEAELAQKRADLEFEESFENGFKCDSAGGYPDDILRLNYNTAPRMAYLTVQESNHRCGIGLKPAKARAIGNALIRIANTLEDK